MTNNVKKLLIPGPVEVSPEVLQALGAPVEPHYGDVWVKKYGQIIDLLKQVFNTQSDVFLMVGSGTCAIDAAMGSSFLTGEKIIVGNNGFFGERLVDIAMRNGLDVVQVKEEWGKAIQPEQIEAALNQHPQAKGVALVHSETSTTVINPIDQIGPLVAEHGMLFIVDAVSSLGGVPYDMDGWQVDICASATQKCLGAPPGLAPIAVSPRAWQSIDRVKNSQHGWYSDLRVWRQYAIDWADWHPSPVTMATNLVNALLVALQQLMQEGISTRMQRYRQLALQLRQGLRAAGMEPYTPDAQLNPVLTAACSPEGVPSSAVVQYLLNEYDIQISGGLGPLKQTIFRIGHMSPVINERDIATVCDALLKFTK